MAPISYGWTLPYSQPEDVPTSIVVNFIECKVQRRLGCKDSSINLPSSSEDGLMVSAKEMIRNLPVVGNGHWFNISE